MRNVCGLLMSYKKVCVGGCDVDLEGVQKAGIQSVGEERVELEEVAGGLSQVSGNRKGTRMLL